MLTHSDKSYAIGPGDFKSVVIIAGEASADLHGANLVTAMKRLNPEVIFSGIGGKKMEQAGVEILFTASDMAVMGLTEVLSKLHVIYQASKAIKSLLKNERPDLLILMDYPDFNIHIARTAKRQGIPVLYYIGPQIWAWRGGRIKKIARRVDRMAVILPFEKDYYRQTSLTVDYVGHPLLDECPRAMDKNRIAHKMGIGRSHPVVGLLPGSRKEEIRNLLPAMAGASEMLAKRYPDLRCILPLAPGIEVSFVQSFLGDLNQEIQLFQGNIYEVLSICDLVLVASGTATLETGIMGVPMVIIYKISSFSYWLGKMIIHVPHIGIVNLIGGEEVVPELIQDEVTADRLAMEALAILEDTEVRENMIRKLRLLKEKLGKGGVSDRTARIAMEMMGGRNV